MAYTLALKPSAPALVYPQRVTLQVEGDQIVDVVYRPDSGAESPFARAKRMGFEQIVAAAASACPSCGIAHALALCQAVESLAEIAVPQRGATLRVVAAELERAASHLATVAAIFTTLDLADAAAPFAAEHTSLVEALRTLRVTDGVTWLVPGGIAHDLDATNQGLVAGSTSEALARLFEQADSLIAQRQLLARTVEVGVLTTSAAEQFGLGGPLARAAGLKVDVRLDAPYGAYTALPPTLVTQEGGDVHARLTLLMIEALESLKLAGHALAELPGGKVRGTLPASLPAGSAESLVEAPRGPLRYQLEAEGGRLSAVHCHPAPQLDRLLARAMLVNASVDDAALIFVSTDPCDSCLGMSYNS